MPDKHRVNSWSPRIAATLDQAAHDIFDLGRWITMVGLTRYLWADTGRIVFAVLYWILAATLLGFLVSRILLRTDIAVFKKPDRWWKTFTNVAINFLLCVVAFGLTLWFVEMLTSAFAESQAR